ncbi:hydrolase [Flavobacteriaceae bacterium R38]|nr:hydrolase [Flavobacteriaceae bacterium R38]
MQSRLLFLLLLWFPLSLLAQKKQFSVKHINETITIDASLDEKVWETAESAKDFWQYFPTDSILAQQQTEIKMLYDDKVLYIGIKVNTAGNDYIVPSLRRDFRAGGNDNISLLFDTFNDGTNAFLFGINPYGVRREALISGGGSDLRGFNTTWDVKWKGESKIYDNYYIAEMAIPLTSFKFKEGETKWRFNSYRFDTQSNEQSTWEHIPQNQFIFNLAFMGDMVFEKPLGVSKTPFALIPYINTQAAKDFEEDTDFSQFKFGGDAKVSIGNGMNLDITVNPDFSNVEVDNIITNLTRFEISLPERRQFFIDNSDLFADFGDSRDANPFFSRRIGIAQDANGNSIENEIIGGVRLSGKLDQNWRLGFLNLQTEKDEANEISSNNNTVFTLQRKLFSRSNIGFIFVNRQAFGSDDFLEEEDRYNRVVGIDYNLASADNTWVGRVYTHKSFSPDSRNEEDFSAGLNLNYNSRRYNFGLRATYVGDDFRSDLGFIRRTDIFRLQPNITRIIWPEKGKINRHDIQFQPAFLWRPGLDFQNTDYNISTSWRAEFKNTARLSAGINNRFTFLTSAFDPTGTEGAIPLPADRGYYYTSFNAEYQSDRRKVFSYRISPSAGAFFNGDIYSIDGQMSLRLQPNFSTSVNFNYNRIELPNPFPSATIFIVSPRFDVTFNKSIFWSTLVQYSNQSDNLGINSRLQWRFAPLSDLFLVYTDNYFTLNTFAPRNRSINLKLTYWLNI